MTPSDEPRDHEGPGGATSSYASGTDGRLAEPRGLRRKTVAIAIVLMLAVASGAYVWIEYLGPRSIRDIADLVTSDPLDSTPGFKHKLAGDKIVVKGKVTNITTYSTSLGNMSFVELDDFAYIRLVIWGDVAFEVGDRIKRDVRFEWSTCNDENHVYSPQLDFPAYAYLPSLAVVLRSVAAVGGTVMNTTQDGEQTITAWVFDQYPPVALSGLNCSLRVGRASFAAEYVEVLGIGVPEYSYGHEIDFIEDLGVGAGRNGSLSFADSDGDGYLSRNDSFVMRNLERPLQDSGAYTYVLILSFAEPPIGRTVPELRYGTT